MNPDWLTVPQAARAANLGRRTIYRAVRDGKLKAARVNGRGDIRIARSWLTQWLEGLASAA